MYAIDVGPSASPHNHRGTDTVATLDLRYHAAVTRGLVATLVTLANR